MVQQHLDVTNLVGGNDDGLLIGDVLRNNLAENALGRNVQTVGRFVHDEKAGAGGKRKTHESLLLLTHGKRTEIQRGRQFKRFKTTLKNRGVKARIERSVEFHIGLHGHIRKFKLFGNKKNVLQNFRKAQLDILAVKRDAARRRTKQAADEIEQSALAGSVLSEKTVDVTGFERKAEIVKHFGAALAVTEGDVFYL